MVQRTRENGSEFGRAGKVLRIALRPLMLNSGDSRMVSRLNSNDDEKLFQADAVSVQGQRNVIDEEVELLTGFEFNIREKLGTSLFAPYISTIDRVAGTLDVDLPAFVPGNMIAAPTGTTHFKIISGAAEIDFENETFVLGTSETGILPRDSTVTSAINLSSVVTANSSKPLILNLGIEFTNN